MQLQFRKLSKRAIVACLGFENVHRARCIYDRIFFQPSYSGQSELIKTPFDVLFYSLGPAYWKNLQLVVKELLHRRNGLRLGLAINCSKEEFADSFSLTAIPVIFNIPPRLLTLFDARVLYSSELCLSVFNTPPKVRVVHSMMTFNSIDGTFPDYAFDMYHFILCAGPHQLDSFRKCALRHPALLGKRLLPAGYPKLDLILTSCAAQPHLRDQSLGSTVVYAPTHSHASGEGLATLSQWGEVIIKVLLAEGHRVIFRPHPFSLFDPDRAVVDRICQLHADNPKLSLDTSTDYTESYSVADLMVTDLSGTGFTFSFGFGRPCIFFAPNTEAERGLSGIQFDARHRIGALVRNIDELIRKAAELCNRDMTDEIVRFRDETVFNVGKSAPYIVDCLEEIFAERERPEWVHL